MQTFKRPEGKGLPAINPVFAHIEVVAKSLENINPLGREQNTPCRYEVVHREFPVELDFSWNAVGNFFSVLVVKGYVDLKFALPFIIEAGKGHEFGSPGIGGRAEALKDAPKVVVLGQNILQNIITTKEGGNLW